MVEKYLPKRVIYLAILFPLLSLNFIFIMVKCGSRTPFPTPAEEFLFNPGNIRYIPVSPSWEGAPWEFSHPIDIFISDDGYIFVADSGNARIVVLNKSGEIVERDDFGNKFTRLMRPITSPRDGSYIHPISLAQDTRTNLYVVDGSNVVYVWNQYINNVGIDSIAYSFLMKEISTQQTVWVNDPDSVTLLEAEGYEISSVKNIYDPSIIDRILAPHPFYDSELSENKKKDI
ncbi:MAG: hypothetical protein ACE5QV_09060, partial [Fidelibacterota bacterium]